VLEAVAELVGLEPPEALVDQEVQRRLHDLAHRLPEGVNLEQYLQATGQEPEAFLAGARGGAAQAVRADLALRSVVAQEEIEATDAEIDAEIERLAERLEEKPAKVRKDLDQRGVLDELRSEVARGKALEFLVQHAEAVDAAGNALDLELPTESESEAETESSSDSDTTEDGEA
jgi:trigger factor